MDINALLAEKKKKANENQKAFLKNSKTNASNTQRQMPLRKSGRGK